MHTLESLKQLNVRASIKFNEREVLYDMVKRCKPEYAVETGSGASTACILLALRENGLGQLTSIDKPDFNGVRKEAGQGDKIRALWKELKTHYPSWVICEEDILQKLPLVVAELPQVDFFFDDSCHTSEHLFAEWEMITDKLHKGSVFGMHDIVGKFGGHMEGFVKR